MQYFKASEQRLLIDYAATKRAFNNNGIDKICLIPTKTIIFLLSSIKSRNQPTCTLFNIL